MENASMPTHPGFKKPVVLIIDDEESIRDACSQIVARDGYLVETAENGGEGLEKIKAIHPDLVLVDLKMPGKNGMEVLDELQKVDPYIIPVVITGYGTVDSAVEAMKRGSYDFIQKPFTPEELRSIIRRGLERRRLIQEAETLRQEKKLMEENFITMVSHQLRSPLVAVQQYFEVILGGMAGQVEDRQKQMLDRASERITSLLKMIGDWLDMARINRGVLADRTPPLAIKNLLVKLIDFFNPMAGKENISLKLDPASEAPMVLGNEESLEQVFSNLISNAIKYNRSGGSISVSIRTSKDAVSISVQDTGIGISREHLPKIFDQFYRVHSKEGHKVKGTGLGLSIARKIVEAHHGTIQVTSEPEVGSTFTVILPKAKEETNDRTQMPSEGRNEYVIQ
jgi:two-component system sensor histidine kinase/response regulator